MLFNKIGGKILCIAGSMILLSGYYLLWHMDYPTEIGYIHAALFVVRLDLCITSDKYGAFFRCEIEAGNGFKSYRS